jgi:hypothetical protein
LRDLARDRNRTRKSVEIAARQDLSVGLQRECRETPLALGSNESGAPVVDRAARSALAPAHRREEHATDDDLAIGCRTMSATLVVYRRIKQRVERPVRVQTGNAVACYRRAAVRRHSGEAAGDKDFPVGLHHD